MIIMGVDQVLPSQAGWCQESAGVPVLGCGDHPSGSAHGSAPQVIWGDGRVDDFNPHPVSC